MNQNISFRFSFFWVNAAQTFDTFNNNFFRAALASFVMFELASLAPNVRSTLAALAVGLLMLPAFLVSALAGELADKYAKARLIRIICLAQLPFVALASIGFKWGSVGVLFTALLGMGAGGSMLSPVKYGILPEIVPTEKLLLANGVIQACVYLAILGGTVAGGMIFSVPRFWLYGILGAAAIATTVSGWLVSSPRATNPQVRVHGNFLYSSYKSMRFAGENRDIFICILAISWFWGVGTAVLSAIPAMVARLGGADSLFTLFLVLFSCGIGVGSVLSQVLLRGKISAKYAVISLLLATAFLADLTFIVGGAAAAPGGTLAAFWHTAAGKRISFDLLGFAVCGGIYIVPLAALLQVLAPAGSRARLIASNNIINALFMVAGSLLCSVLLWFGRPVSVVLGVLAGINLPTVAALFFMLKRTRGMTQ